MTSRRVLSIFLFAWASAGRLPAQSNAPQPQLSSYQPPSDARVRKVGEPISGRVMQPVYVFDHLVIPIGTAATGRISAIDPVPGRTRTLDHWIDRFGANG
jgi:hypothetical protein